MILLPKLVAVLFAGACLAGAWNDPAPQQQFIRSARFLTTLNMLCVAVLAFR